MMNECDAVSSAVWPREALKVLFDLDIKDTSNILMLTALDFRKYKHRSFIYIFLEILWNKYVVQNQKY